MLSAVGDDAAAVAAYRRVIAGADGDLAAKAAFNIACLGSPPAVAEAAYRVVIDTGHRDAAPKAAYNLGCLLQEAGDLAGANDAFLRAAESGHVAVAAEAALKLEELRVAAIRRAAAVPELPQRLTRHRRRTDRRLRGHRPKWFAGNRFSGARRARGASY
jgi:hypothetical protein